VGCKKPVKEKEEEEDRTWYSVVGVGTRDRLDGSGVEVRGG
jgi:hypothetical protein